MTEDKSESGNGDCSLWEKNKQTLPATANTMEDQDIVEVLDEDNS